MTIWTKERYEQLVILAYEGFTGFLINQKMGAKNACNYLTHLDLTLYHVRRLRQEGTTLKALLDDINWGFLTVKEEGRKKRTAHGMVQARAKLDETRKAVNVTEASEVLRLLREIHSALMTPAGVPA